MLPAGTYLPIADAVLVTGNTDQAVASSAEAGIFIIQPDNPVDFVVSALSETTSQGLQLHPPAHAGTNRSDVAFNLFTLAAPATVHATANASVSGCGKATISSHRGSALFNQITVRFIKLG